MVTKKSKKANLENKRTLFLEIGMMLALALALMALETDQKEPSQNDYQFIQSGVNIEEEIVMRTDFKERKEPPPEIIQTFEIKDNLSQLEEPDFNFNVDADENDTFDPDMIWQPKEEPVEDTDVVLIADRMPLYNGCGLDCFHKFIQETVEYPLLAIENNIEGRVYVRFVVDKKGYLKNIEIIKGRHPLLDNAVIEALNKSDRWEPGMQGPMPVNVSMSMPVTFTLQTRL